MTYDGLAGRRIVITRPPHKAQAFADQLRGYGAEPVILPMIDIQPPADPQPLDDALTHLDRYDWLIVTSANTIDHIWQRLEVLELDPAVLPWPPIAAIGPATASALTGRGLTAALVPEEHVAEALFDALNSQTDLRGRRVLLPQANIARPVLADSLRAAGANVDTVTAYETVRPELDPALLARPVDAFTFTSSSTVRHFAEMFDDPAVAVGSALVACIGPVTADTAREFHLPVHVVAEPYTIEGMLAALSGAFERTSSE